MGDQDQVMYCPKCKSHKVYICTGSGKPSSCLTCEHEFYRPTFTQKVAEIRKDFVLDDHDCEVMITYQLSIAMNDYVRIRGLQSLIDFMKVFLKDKLEREVQIM